MPFTTTVEELAKSFAEEHKLEYKDAYIMATLARINQNIESFREQFDTLNRTIGEISSKLPKTSQF